MEGTNLGKIGLFQFLKQCLCQMESRFEKFRQFCNIKMVFIVAFSIFSCLGEVGDVNEKSLVFAAHACVISSLRVQYNKMLVRTKALYHQYQVIWTCLDPEMCLTQNPWSKSNIA